METSRKDTDTILVVDDDELVRDSLKMILDKGGYNTLTAEDGDQALQILKKEPVALIICDQNMPGKHGVDVFKEAYKICPETVRVGLTGVGDLNTLKDLVNEGQISQFILKPWDNTMLLKMIQSAMDRVHLEQENKRLQEKIRVNHEILSREINLGGRIQNTILNGSIPKDLSGIDIAAISYPSKEIDGDFYDFYRPSQECLDIVLADVMGKGLPAALVGTAVKTQLLRFAVPVSTSRIYSKSSGWRQDIFSPASIMSHVHSQIIKPLINLEYFVTLSYARFNFQKRVLTFVDCGSTKPLHYRSRTGTVAVLKGVNFPLGMVDNDIYQSVEVPFEQGDLFVFYSDGITEAQNGSGEQYGMERLIAFVKLHNALPLNELVNRIKEDVSKFSGKESYDDDLTVVLTRITEVLAVKESSLFRTATFASDLSQLSGVRDFVKRFCVNMPGDAERLSYQLQLVVNEAFSNIAQHGFPPGQRGEIIIDIEQTYEGVLVSLRDQGVEFDPREIQEPSFAGDKYGGFGLFMIKEISDQVTYSAKAREGGWNQLTILKRYLSNEVPMKFSHQTQEDILIITLEGASLDAKEAPNFKQDVLNLIADNNIRHVVLNLEKLNFIDSSGLGSFLSILRQLNTRGGDLKIAQMNKSIRTVFELVCMHKIFEIYNSTQEALRSLTNKVKV